MTIAPVSAILALCSKPHRLAKTPAKGKRPDDSPSPDEDEPERRPAPGRTIDVIC